MNEIKQKQLRVDFIVVICLVFAGIVYSIVTKDTSFGRGLWGGLAFSLPSILYLGWRRPKPWRKIVLAVLIFGLILGYFFEFIQEFNHAYAVESRVFSKIFGVLPPDNVMGHSMMAALTFTVYEHFYVAKKSNRLNPKWRKMLVIALVAALLVTALYFVWPGAIQIRFSYAIFGTIALLPLVRYVWNKPSDLPMLTSFIPFFALLYFVAEWFAVKYSWWVYPGDSYLGWVDAFGIRFPFEELLFWMIFYAPAIVSYYKQYIEVPVSSRS